MSRVSSSSMLKQCWQLRSTRAPSPGYGWSALATGLAAVPESRRTNPHLRAAQIRLDLGLSGLPERGRTTMSAARISTGISDRWQSTG